jgi:POT family proton-dependent oligopeptide transporter
LGGLLADRVLGYRKSIYIGGAMMGLGYMGLAIPGTTAFYISLSLIIFGNGFFKPNISTLLGNLYQDEDVKPLKDSGYNIFYMGINIGAFICNFFAAYLRNTFGWGYAFFAAGLGMFIGLIIFAAGNRNYAHVDVRKPVQKEDMSLARIFSIVLLPSIVAGILGWFAIPGDLFGSDSTDAFIFGAIPIALFYVNLMMRSNAQDRKPIAAMLAIFGVVIVFWAIFKQNGTALTTYAEFYTDREVPSSLEKPAATLGMVQNVGLEQDSFPKYDADFRTQRGSDGKPVKVVSHHPYLSNLPTSAWPTEEKPLQLFSTELFQSINPFFVVILTPVVVAFFAFLKRRKMEPSTPAKIGWGLFITALSTTVMISSVIINGGGKASALWLIGTYGVITVGELFLSPMGLSLVSKLSPPRITALMMGGWFLSTSIGNKLSGVLASMWDKYDNKSWFFAVNCVVALIASLAIFAMLKWLRNILKEHNA